MAGIAIREFRCRTSLLDFGLPYAQPVSFGFVKRERKAYHCSTCRDYCQDYLFLDFEQPVKKLKWNNMTIAYWQRNNHENMAGALDLIEQAENDLKISRHSSVLRPKNWKQGLPILLFVAHKDWLTASPLVSLYTLLIREGIMHTPGVDWLYSLKEIADGKTKAAYYMDKGILEGALPTIQKLARVGFREVFGTDLKKNYPAIAKSYSHGAFGICGITSPLYKEKVKEWCPHWNL